MSTFPPFGEKDLIETRKVLQQYGDETLQSMRDILIRNDHVATGELIRSLSYRIFYDGSFYQLSFSMTEHGKYVEYGTRPGKGVSRAMISNISKWAAVKGIPQSAVFPIAKSISKRGIRATPFFNKSIDEGQALLVRDLAAAFATDTADYLRRMMGSLGKP